MNRYTLILNTQYTYTNAVHGNGNPFWKKKSLIFIKETISSWSEQTLHRAWNLIIMQPHGNMILMNHVIWVSARFWGIIFSHRVHLKVGHRFNALSNVRSDRDDIVPLIHPVESTDIEPPITRRRLLHKYQSAQARKPICILQAGLANDENTAKLTIPPRILSINVITTIYKQHSDLIIWYILLFSF